MSSFDLQRTRLLCEKLGLDELPVAVLFSDERPQGDVIGPPAGPPDRDQRLKNGELDLDLAHQIYPCVLAYVRRVRRSGATACFDAKHFGCPGGGAYLKLIEPSPLIPHIVSTGLEGAFAGERYVKTPELVSRMLSEMNIELSAQRYCLFKRADRLTPNDEPEVLAFFASPDQLSGLCNLVNFAAEDWQAVIAPFGAACATLVLLPLNEGQSERPRAVLGGMDISARPFLEPDLLSLALPRKLFDSMLACMDQAFLDTHSWQIVRKRIERGKLKK